MDWMGQLGGVLNQYANGTGDHAQATSDFDHIARNAPPDALGSGLAEAFRSPQTPAFGTMLSELFGRSGGGHQAGVVNALIAALGPMVASRVLSSRNSAVAKQVEAGHPLTPEAAAQIHPEDIQSMAAEAEKKDPSVVDRMARMYADQPALIKGLGGAALVVAMAKIAQSQSRG
jgi:hypothetical protein